MCSGYLAIGTRNAEYYRYLGVNPERIFIVPYAVNNDFFISQTEEHVRQRESERTKLNIPQDHTVVLYASKLSQSKHPQHLLIAHHLLKQRRVKVSLVFVGSGSEEAGLHEYVAQHDVKDVHFLGFQNQSELPKFFALADVFALPAKNEAWGLVINEAMCAGLPIVTTYEVGCVPDLVHHGENGFLHDTGDVGALTEHLETLCNHPDLRKQMGEQSRKIIEQWDYQEDIKQFLIAMRTICDE